MAFNKFAKAVEEAATHDDYNEAQSGPGFTPLPEGPVRLRFVNYIELGKHEEEYQGKKREREKVYFAFEATGPKLEPREDGQPHIIHFTLTKSQSEKATFYKLFRKMNYDGKHKIFASMLGDGFRGQIYQTHRGEGKDKKTYAGLRDVDGNFSISPPYYDDPESGERRMLAIPEPVSECRLFLWALADKEQWDSIFIDGEYEARDDKPARSKNVHQLKIKASLDWQGCPMQEILFGDLDLGDAEKPGRTEKAADVDPLDDIPS